MGGHALRHFSPHHNEWVQPRAQGNPQHLDWERYVRSLEQAIDHDLGRPQEIFGRSHQSLLTAPVSAEVREFIATRLAYQEFYKCQPEQEAPLLSQLRSPERLAAAIGREPGTTASSAGRVPFPPLQGRSICQWSRDLA